MKRLFPCIVAVTFLLCPLSVHPRGAPKFRPGDREEAFTRAYSSGSEIPGGRQKPLNPYQGMEGDNSRVPTLRYASNTKHYDESLFTMTEKGHFSVELLVKGGDTVDIIIHDSHDVDVEGGVVEAFMWTPEEGVLDSEKLDVSELRGGRYRVMEIAPRDGVWGIFFRIRKEGTFRADDLVDSVVIEISGAVK